jgi:Xaa-Pro aminopeptidase
MKKVLVALLFFSEVMFAQPLSLNTDVFAKRREEFMRRMEPGSVAVFPSAPEVQRNLDVEYEYRQESNFYYLTGYEEPGSILVLSPSARRHRFILFVRDRNEGAETYEGARSGVGGAMTSFRADTAYLADDFDHRIYSITGMDKTLYYTFGINADTDRKIKRICIEGRSSGNWPIIDPAPTLAGMRLIKNDGDWTTGLQQAIDISAAAHREAMRSARPGMYEYEIQAVFEYVYRKSGSPRNGYPCIIGSGPNATILHYSKNTRQMNAGELVLMDCAAEYGYYSADITRTIPVNGTFSREQRAVYSIVLESQNAALAMIRPGITLSDIDSVITEVLGKGLLSLGFIKQKSDAKGFALHGYSHWIGMEVHDVGGYVRNKKEFPLEPGMVFTLEPGIYVREAVIAALGKKGYTSEEVEKIRAAVAPYLGIGVRIEDDVAVTADGCKNLTAAVPRTIDAIESLMKEKGIGKPAQ